MSNQQKSIKNLKRKASELEKQAIKAPNPNKQIENLQISSDSDDSDNEVIKAKIGRIPWKWYDNYKHLGYDENMKKVEKARQGDKIDELIQRSENPNWWKIIRDELNQQDVILTNEQLEVLDRIRQGKFADKRVAEQDFEIDIGDPEVFPLHANPPSKSKFMPSKWERIMVNKLVQGIKSGQIVIKDPEVEKQKQDQEKERTWDLWNQTDDNDALQKTSILPAIQAPKIKLPGHAESYNPPEEYLLSEKEIQEWLKTDPEDRQIDFLPHKYDCLRHVEFYNKLINERFDRCLDLYLCPRIRKKKLDIDPDSLIPNLPKPQELRPFPTSLNIQYKGHKSRIRGLSVHNSGQFLASCDEKGEIIVWDVLTSRILWRYKIEGEGINYALQFNSEGILAVANDTNLYIFNLDVLTTSQYKENEKLIDECKKQHQLEYNALLKWIFYESEQAEFDVGLRIKIPMNYLVKWISFHAKGDYFSTVSPMAEKKNEQVIIHSFSKASSSRPFSKSKGNVDKVIFHPHKPFLFILTQKHVFVYNLQKQATVKKLMTGAQWNSCLDIHPYGDNLIVGSYDKKICWFDLDLQNTPYKNLKYHEKAVRQVTFHKKYPLFASSSDDGTINIFHGKVFNDMLENALIIPLKVLKGHSIKHDLGVLDIVFHPSQPWIFSCGADHRIFLWT